MTQRHWLASYGSIPHDINADAYCSVVYLMDQAMKRHAHRPAMRCAGQTLSYADLDCLSRDFAAYLQGPLGVKKGDRIAVMMPNLLAFPIAFLGAGRSTSTRCTPRVSSNTSSTMRACRPSSSTVASRPRWPRSCPGPA